jgi:hypothetical protein
MRQFTKRPNLRNPYSTILEHVVFPALFHQTLSRSSKWFAFVSLMLCVSGCATTVISTPVLSQSNQPIAGMAYSLPKSQMRLTVSRKLGNAEDVAKAKKVADEAEKKSTALASKLGELKTQVTEEKKLVRVAVGEGKKRFEEQLEMLNARVLVLENDVKKAATAKKEAADKLDKAEAQKDKYAEEVKIELLDVVPDRNNTFVANLNHLPTRDDSMQLTVENGLLNSTGKAVADDKVADILISIASIVGGNKSSKPLSGGFNLFSLKITPETETNKTEERSEKCPIGDISKIFDPTNQKETKEALDVIYKRLVPSFTIELGSVVGSAESGVPDNATLATYNLHSSSQPIDGLAYRPLRELPVTVTPKENGNCKFVNPNESKAFVFTVLDSSRIAYLPMHSGALNNNTNSFAFSKGSPTEFMTGRASEIAALLKIPVNVAKALISVPTDFIKLRVDYSTEETKLLKQQLDLLKATQDLKDKIKDLNDGKVE